MAKDKKPKKGKKSAPDTVTVTDMHNKVDSAHFFDAEQKHFLHAFLDFVSQKPTTVEPAPDEPETKPDDTTAKE